MGAERWSQIEALFKGAVEKPAEAWDTYLETHCDEPQLRAEVKALLHAETQADTYLENLVAGNVQSLIETNEEARIGSRIGPYSVLGKLGRGGVSSVFLVRRDDEQFKKFLALKLIRRGMDTADILNRFRSERQILASLNHPNIARFYDGGTTEDGLPYFVMERIEGMPITQYCDQKKLSLRQRLQLFRKVCAAVQTAHRNLVVHRDLKPSNILVTAEGIPKLLDFGIAKLLNPDLAIGTMVATSQTTKIMTPGYASPEQVAGARITTASDIYSLGVLLYELLTGQRPFAKSTDWLSLERQIREATPKDPSQIVFSKHRDGEGQDLRQAAEARGATPEQLRRTLSGDLDKITLHALQKEPARRYGSVEQFSEDIKRHLGGHPVIAQRDTLTYRTGKFLSRHRFGVGVASVITSMALILLIALWLQSTQLRQERDRVTHQRDRATQALQLVDDIFKMTDPDETRGEAITAMELLDRGAARVVNLKDAPDTAVLLETLAGLYEDLALYQKAVPLRERSLRIHRKTFGEISPEVAQGLNNIAVLLTMTGDYVAAEPYFRECLAMRRQVYPNPYPAVSDALSNLGLILQDLGDYQQALVYYQEGQAIEMKGQKNDFDRAKSYLTSNLALLYHDLGDYEVSEAMYRDQIALRLRVLDEDDQNAIEAYQALGKVLLAAGKYDEADQHLSHTLAWYRGHGGRENPGLARILTYYGHLLLARGKMEQARQHIEEALTQREHQLGTDHLEYSASLLAMADYHRRMGADSEAIPLLKQALAIYRRAGLAEHPEMVSKLLILGRIYENQGACNQALPLLQSALAIRQRALPPGNWLIAEVQSALGSCLWKLGEVDSAKPMMVESLQVIQKHLGPNHPQTKLAQSRLDSYNL